MSQDRKDTIMKFRVENDVKASVMKQSTEKGVTVSEYIRILIEEDLNRRELC